MEQAIGLSDLTGRKYEYVVFGASGFTGQFVVEELARLVANDNRKRHWAVAGRSETKLRETLRLASENTGMLFINATFTVDPSIYPPRLKHTDFIDFVFNPGPATGKISF
jgi:hypothetical protein